MKKQTFLLGIAVLLLASCKKEETFCWTCTMKVTTQGQTATQTTTICDKTREEIEDYERAGTTTTTSGTIKTVTETNCHH